MSRLQPAFLSYSVPTSPAVSRSSKDYPATPQRESRQQYRHSQSFHRSPITPSTPYTPLSLRSTDSNNSSTLTTPDNLSISLRKRIAFISVLPELSRVRDAHGKPATDVTDNWQSRASENGIRVSSSDQSEEKQHRDDEGAFGFFLYMQGLTKRI